jgi:hypothetical protein
VRRRESDLRGNQTLERAHITTKTHEIEDTKAHEKISEAYVKIAFMILESIEAHHFRNLSGNILWGRGLNIIYGDNGQGKTNWLEAIYLLSRTKSFRTSRLQEATRFGENEAFVRGTVSRGEDLSRELQITLQGNSK